MTIEERRAPDGQWNTAPAGFREISEDEFARSMFFLYTPVAHEYRQITKDEHGVSLGQPAKSIHMYYFHDGTGIAMCRDYADNTYRTMKVQYFRFGCEHAYEEIFRPANHRSGLHTDRCSKCGYIWTYDTSD